ncbi:unnamed protein product [Polarella glacialis]|uniref:Uncharacterized protein n=1 Tax=Polarella glacialis TaxID=89957 RepID=A0A813KBM0_POLGL|nr:unnamed protein product [Polarella glacialis]
MMCFICEHQWTNTDRTLEILLGSHFCLSTIMVSFLLGSHAAVVVAPLSLLATCWACRPAEQCPTGCKCCPRCGVVIEKDGGCDHMTCRCGHRFSWSTLR